MGIHYRGKEGRRNMASLLEVSHLSIKGDVSTRLGTRVPDRIIPLSMTPNEVNLKQVSGTREKQRKRREGDQVR